MVNEILILLESGRKEEEIRGKLEEMRMECLITMK